MNTRDILDFIPFAVGITNAVYTAIVLRRIHKEKRKDLSTRELMTFFMGVTLFVLAMVTADSF